MKIYCILNDSIPLGNKLEEYLKSRNLHHFTQVTNFFSTTSTMSLLTGKLPSDLEKDGIGYHTHFNYKVDNRINYPWKQKLMISQLNKVGWDIHFHNANWFYLTICDDDFIIKTTSMPCTVENEEKFRQTKVYNQELQNKNSSYYLKEKKFINKIQNEKTDRNKFYFIKNNQYHEAIVNNWNKEDALDLIIDWYKNWNFDEEDALFYIFSDHHDFSMIDELCQPPQILTWSFVKDNAYKLNINKNYMHIGDFYTLSTITSEKDDKCRIYFSEDARNIIDNFNSTTAIACKFIDWIDDKANELLQVSYFKPENKYYGFRYNLNNKKLTIEKPDETLKSALKKRFKWVR